MFIERFTNYLQFEKRFSPHTVTAYQKDLQQYQSFLKESDLGFELAQHTHIRSWVVSLLEKGSDSKTINRKVSTLRSFYKFLIREKVLANNPMILVRTPKVSKKLPVFVEDQKMSSLLDSETGFSNDFSGLRNRLIMEILFGTGIRLAELISLKDEDVNFYEKHVKVLGKRNKERIIPINNTLIKLLKEYLTAKKSQKFDNNSASLIVTNEGNNAYPKFIYRIVKSSLSNITTSDKKSPHILRHSFATSLLNNGAELNAIKELLGHASLAATQVYTHNSVEKLKLIYKQAHPKA